jgi:mRNA interferase MazF
VTVRASRGEVWLVNLEPVLGHEQGRKRPAVIVSNDGFNYGPAGILVVVPLTTKDRNAPLRVRIEPPDGGLDQVSFAITEAVRSISTKRLLRDRPYGRLSQQAMATIDDRLRIVLDL